MCLWALMDKKKSLGGQSLCRGLSGGRREVSVAQAVPQQEAGAVDKVWLFLLTVKSWISSGRRCAHFWGSTFGKGWRDFDGTF